MELGGASANKGLCTNPVQGNPNSIHMNNENIIRNNQPNKFTRSL
jgi:hypothetical protein